MYYIRDLGMFEDIIYESKNKKIILYGIDDVSKKISEMLNLLDVKVDYYIDINNNTVDVKTPYDLLYEDINEIYIIISQDEEKALEVKYLLESILGEDNSEKYCTTLYNSMGQSEWDFIDINLGYSHQKQYQKFTTSGGKESEYTIVTLGGSTTFSDHKWGCNLGIKSWSEKLRDIFEINGMNVNILCGGVQGYSSSQELIKFLRDVPNIKPNMVISYSGVNDIFRNQSTNKYPFAFGHLTWLFNDMKKTYKSNMKNVHYGVENLKSYSQQWIENIQIMHELSKLYNIKFFSFLQPIPGVSKYKYSIEEKYSFSITKDVCAIESLKLRKKIYDDIENMMIDKDYIINLKYIFDGVDEDEDIYYDHCHVYEKGNQIIADNIYKHIKDYVYNKK